LNNINRLATTLSIMAWLLSTSAFASLNSFEKFYCEKPQVKLGMDVDVPNRDFRISVDNPLCRPPRTLSLPENVFISFDTALRAVEFEEFPAGMTINISNGIGLTHQNTVTCPQ